MKFSRFVCVILLGVGAFGQTNPVPLIYLPLVPTSVAPGSGSLTLTVNGTGFVSGAVVKWNGSSASTTFVNSSQVTAVISASNLAKAGTATITVANPAPGGGMSNFESFAISSPNPASAITFAMINEPGDITPATYSYDAGVVAGDFNRDGKLDVAWDQTDNYEFGTFAVGLGKGGGTFQPVNVTDLGSGLGQMLTGDFNRDGVTDLVILNDGTPKFPGISSIALLGTGDGTFPLLSTTTEIVNYLTQVAGDMNRDGELDLVAGGTGLTTFLGNGDGTFQGALTSNASDSYGVIALGDFNRDGNLDIVSDLIFYGVICGR
jgi:hypothetical protein